MKTVLFQSYREEGVPPWLQACMKSVQSWAVTRDFEYSFFGNEFLELAPSWFRQKAKGRMPVITDLCRLLQARHFLENGYERVIWLDADILIFDGENLFIDAEKDFAFAREIWVQPDSKGGLKAYRNVHNAASVYIKGNAFLDFYIHASQSIMSNVPEDKGFPNQLVGPKLLTAFHNIVGFNLIDDVGMLSPLVIRDILAGGGGALDLLRKQTPKSLRAANLCSSLVGKTTDGVSLTDQGMMDVVDRLIDKRITF